jgi:hypothetical protein
MQRRLSERLLIARASKTAQTQALEAMTGLELRNRISTPFLSFGAVPRADSCSLAQLRSQEVTAIYANKN